MANLSITITNRQALAGLAKVSLWNAYNWGAFKWLEGTEKVPFLVTHAISESTSPDSSMGKQPTHAINESTAPDSTINFDNRVAINESITTDADMGSEELSDGSGWSYVYPDNVTNAEQRSFATWASAAAASASWTCQAVSTTVWS